MTIEVKINDHNTVLDSSLDIEKLLLEQGYKGKMVAVAVNKSFVPRSSYSDFMINNGDEIEIVAPMQGG